MVQVAYINGVPVEDHAGAALKEQDMARRRTPPSVHEVMSERGITWTCRLDIPIRAVGGYDDIADLLRSLADRLEGIRRRHGGEEVLAAGEAQRECMAIRDRMKALEGRHYGDARHAIGRARGDALTQLYHKPEVE